MKSALGSRTDGGIRVCRKCVARQCLDHRIPDQPSLQQETLAWEQRRNAQLRTIDWRFTTEDARVKLKRLYPSFQS